jgi:hypothetical protein
MDSPAQADWSTWNETFPRLLLVDPIICCVCECSIFIPRHALDVSDGCACSCEREASSSEQQFLPPAAAAAVPLEHQGPPPGGCACDRWCAHLLFSTLTRSTCALSWHHHVCTLQVFWPTCNLYNAHNCFYTWATRQSINTYWNFEAEIMLFFSKVCFLEVLRNDTATAIAYPNNVSVVV